VARGKRGRAGSAWRWLVPAVCVVAGLIFATSAQASHGTDLRSPESANLADLIRAAEAQVAQSASQLAQLQGSVLVSTNQAGRENSAVGAAQQAAVPLQLPAGLTAVSGPGIRVVLDDARGTPAGAEVDPNQLVVHQSDLQAVVNALWTGGAEAMTIAGQRVIATSAVRCVGNTLLLNGRVFSPPFPVEAIGPYGTMRSALDRSPGVILYKQAAGLLRTWIYRRANRFFTTSGVRRLISLSYAKAVPR